MGMFKLFLSFEGRINRATWWLCTGLLMIANLILSMGLNAILVSAMQPQGLTALTRVGAIANGLVALILFYPTLAVGAKRMHDRDRSGWWMVAFIVPIVLLVLLTPFALSANGAVNGGVAVMIVVLMAASIMAIGWNFVELAFLAGTAGDNRFGTPMRLADKFAMPIASDDVEPVKGDWTTSINLAAVETRSDSPASTTAPQPTAPTRKPARQAAQRPQGFGRRTQAAR